jgi:molecular chaperone GrpE
MKQPQAQKKEKETRGPAQDELDTQAQQQADQAANDEETAEAPEEEMDAQEQADEEDTVESLTEQLGAQKDKYIRLMAEFDNFKRRTSKEYERMVESANERLMIQIIEARESFERALKVDEGKTDLKTFFDGMKLIFTKLDDVLAKNGLSVFTEVGDEFDPEIHDAMMKAPNEEIPEDHIAEIYEKGYKLRNHVIKHAKVIVSSGKAEAEAAEN